MNKQVKDVVSTIKKIESLKFTEEDILEDDTKALKFEYQDELFFMMVKCVSAEYIVINTTNPISLENITFKNPKLEVMNQFNTLAVGTKCILSDQEKSHFLFVREEFIRIKDVFNKDLISSRIEFSIELIKSAVGVFESINDEMNEDVQP